MVPVPISLWRDKVVSLYAPNASNRKSESTFRKMERMLDVVAELGITSTDQLDTDFAREFVNALTSGPNTVRGDVGYLRAAITIAVEEGWLDKQPLWRRVVPREAKMTRNPVLRLKQMQTLLSYLEGRARGFRSRRLYALTSLIALTGARRDEALHARLEDFDWTAPVLWIKPRPEVHSASTGNVLALKTTASARALPICPELRQVFREWMGWTASPWLFPNSGRTGPWGAASQHDRPLGQLQAAAIAAGVGHVTWHGLRHSFATIALRHWGRDLAWVSKVLGHKSIRTTERYLHLDDPDYLCQELDTLSYGRPA